jgi:pyruvate kinase
LAHPSRDCKLFRVRHTKIIATVGPASDDDATLDVLIAAGVDVFRLNFSHGSHESHARTFARVREAAARSGRHVGILQDLSGPKIRTGRLRGDIPVELKPGDTLTIGRGEFEGTATRISTTYEDLIRAVRPGDHLLLDDGRIELRVLDTTPTELRAAVVNGGTLGSRKGINAPGVPLPASAVTAKDIEDLRFGLELGVDFVALSFVQTAADLQRARELMNAYPGGREVPLVAKLERPEALAHLPDILGACDAVMVARGDLGLELPLERVPRAQKEITRQARARGVPVIVATQVLESMRTEPRPTRAEVSDAANAVDDGVDAIMLAGETAVGAYPAKAVQTLDAVIRDAEAIPLAGVAVPPLELPQDVAALGLCEAAVTLATRAGADAIVAVTRAGATARILSALRPRAPIVAATSRDAVARRVGALWGVAPLLTTTAEDVGQAGLKIAAELVDRALVRPGGTVVLVSVNPDLGRGDANYLKLQKLA